jgi:hypothetical protein
MLEELVRQRQRAAAHDDDDDDGSTTATMRKETVAAGRVGRRRVSFATATATTASTAATANTDNNNSNDSSSTTTIQCSIQYIEPMSRDDYPEYWYTNIERHQMARDFFSVVQIYRPDMDDSDDSKDDDESIGVDKGVWEFRSALFKLHKKCYKSSQEEIQQQLQVLAQHYSMIMQEEDDNDRGSGGGGPRGLESMILQEEFMERQAKHVKHVLKVQEKLLPAVAVNSTILHLVYHHHHLRFRFQIHWTTKKSCDKHRSKRPSSRHHLVVPLLTMMLRPPCMIVLCLLMLISPRKILCHSFNKKKSHNSHALKRRKW